MVRRRRDKVEQSAWVLRAASLQDGPNVDSLAFSPCSIKKSGSITLDT